MTHGSYLFDGDEEGGGGGGGEGAEDADRALLRPPRGARLYEDLADEAAAAGVAISLFAVAPPGGGCAELAALRPLPLRSGGILNFYASAAEAPMTEDVYKQLVAPYGSQLWLRLRCHSDLTVARHYGHLAPDAEVANLFHLAGCHAHTTVGFDLEFASGHGFSDLSEHDAAPTLQLAVIYTSVVRATATGDAGDAGNAGVTGNARGAGERWVVVRRLRLHTVQLPVARSARALLEAAQPEPLMVLLVHKVMRAAEEQGFREGRLLLQDWVLVLLAKHALATRPRASPPSADPDALCASLRAVPRWVFALLRGPLLSSHTPLSPHRVGVDGRIALLALYASLPPHCLLTAIYPRLYPYKSADERPASPLGLSWAEVRASGCRLFLLDAYLVLYVYLAAAPPVNVDAAAPPGMKAPAAEIEFEIEFPPSKQSVLWRHISKIKAAQLQTPKVVVCRAGTADGAAFEAHLIEDLPEPGAGGFTFEQFVDWNQQELQGCIEEHQKDRTPQED